MTSGQPSDRYPGLGDAYLTPLNREPLPLVRVSATSEKLSSGRVRFIVPLGSARLITKVTVQFCPDDTGLDPFPNLRVATNARLWLALRDRNRAGNSGHVTGVRNVLGTQAAPVVIPAPLEIAAAGAGLSGHAETFGGPGFIFAQVFLAGATLGLMAPTGIFDECIGELTVDAVGFPCPPGVWNLQTRWEPWTGMSEPEWSQIKTLLDPRASSSEVATQIEG